MTFSRSSHARLEKKLNLLIAEVRAGKREGSVISTQTFDTAAPNDRETWKALRRELEDIGISPSVISEKRQFIIAWFQEAVAAGKLDEDAPSDDHGSDVSLFASEEPAGGSPDETVATRELSSMMIEAPTTEQATDGASVPSAHRLSWQPADVSHPRPSREKTNSQLRVTYLLNKLRGRDKQFLEAAMEGDVSIMKILLEKGVDTQTRGGKKNTALHVAARNRNEEAVILLLIKGADVHATNEAGETALHHAAAGGSQRILHLLLDKGADLELRSSTQSTALMFAAEGGYLSLVRLLLNRGADVKSVDFYDDTALHVAARPGSEAVVQLLLDMGADIDSKNRVGNTALTCAAGLGYESVVRLLMKNGADIESKSRHDFTALSFAALKGHESTVRLLLEEGAKIESKETGGETALMRAASSGNEATVRLLLEWGADVNTKNVTGATALDFAQGKSVKQLLRSARAISALK